MEKNYASILQVITCILLVICVFKIYSLDNQIQNMQNNLSNRVSEVRSDVNDISYEVRTVLEEEASFLTVADWTYGTFNEEAQTVEVLCRISPKEYSAETTAVVVYNNQEYPLTFENGMYTGVVEIPVFEEAHIELVRFKDGNNVRTQELGWYITARSEYLPITYAQYSGAKNYNIGKGVTTVNFDGEIFVEVIRKGDWSDIKEMSLVECIDDKEISRTKITYETNNTSSWCAWEKDIDVPFGSIYTAYVETVDKYDLHYRNLIALEKIDESGVRVDEWNWWSGTEADIYDADGNPLYVKDIEEY